MTDKELHETTFQDLRQRLSLSQKAKDCAYVAMNRWMPTSSDGIPGVLTNYVLALQTFQEVLEEQSRLIEKIHKILLGLEPIRSHEAATKIDPT